MRLLMCRLSPPLGCANTEPGQSLLRLCGPMVTQAHEGTGNSTGLPRARDNQRGQERDRQPEILLLLSGTAITSFLLPFSWDPRWGPEPPTLSVCTCQVATHTSVPNRTPESGLPSVAGAPDIVSPGDRHRPPPWRVTPFADGNPRHCALTGVVTHPNEIPGPGQAAHTALLLRTLHRPFRTSPTSFLSQGQRRSLHNAHSKSDGRGSARRHSGHGFRSRGREGHVAEPLG